MVFNLISKTIKNLNKCIFAISMANNEQSEWISILILFTVTVLIIVFLAMRIK